MQLSSLVSLVDKSIVSIESYPRQPIFLYCVALYIYVHVHVFFCCLLLPHHLSCHVQCTVCTCSTVGKSIAWKAEGRGFESHPRHLIFLWASCVVLCCFAFLLCCCCLAFLSISRSDCSCIHIYIYFTQHMHIFCV